MMTSHTKSILQYTAVTFSIFFIVGQLGFVLLSKIVLNSEYRLATAVAPGSRFIDKDVVFIIGDSRMMDGVNAFYANKKINNENKIVYNFSFNGLGLPDSLSFIRIFKDKCKCKIIKIIVNSGSLKDRTKEYSEFQLFAAGFDNKLSSNMFENNVSMKYSTYLFPLIHFNNEVFLRSLYFLLRNKSDQNHSNAYKFKVSENIIASLRKKNKSLVVDNANIIKLVELTNNNDIDLAVVTSPHHGMYVNNIKEYSAYTDKMMFLSEKHNYSYYDHSHLYTEYADYFSDLLHLNTNGQSNYTNFLIKQGLLN